MYITTEIFTEWFETVDFSIDLEIPTHISCISFYVRALFFIIYWTDCRLLVENQKLSIAIHVAIIQK
jgi:hypothetical protein